MNTPWIENTFIDHVLLFEELALKDIKKLVSLANSAHEEEVFGLKLYAKLIDLKKEEKIFGENICDLLYDSCAQQSGEVTLKM